MCNDINNSIMTYLVLKPTGYPLFTGQNNHSITQDIVEDLRSYIDSLSNDEYSSVGLTDDAIDLDANINLIAETDTECLQVQTVL